MKILKARLEILISHFKRLIFKFLWRKIDIQILYTAKFYIQILFISCLFLTSIQEEGKRGGGYEISSLKKIYQMQTLLKQGILNFFLFSTSHAKFSYFRNQRFKDSYKSSRTFTLCSHLKRTIPPIPSG